jgi:hypothetical protein
MIRHELLGAVAAKSGHEVSRARVEVLEVNGLLAGRAEVPRGGA